MVKLWSRFPCHLATIPLVFKPSIVEHVATLKYINKTNRIPKGTYFVMGDHRSVSKDSRYIGTIKRKNIVGVVKLRYWPLNQIKVY